MTDSPAQVRIAAHRGEWRQLQQRRGPLAELPVLLVANDREVMGDLANDRLSNFIGSAVVGVSVLVSLAAFPLLVLTRGGSG